MRLYHFSDDPRIGTFVPRPVRVPSRRKPGMDWLNGPLVWAIEDRFDFLYHFPRDCPRIAIWPTEATTETDRQRWLGPHRAAAYVEERWLPALAAARLYRYEFAPSGFEDLNNAGMWVSRRPVDPVGLETLADLPDSFAPRGVDLRVVDSLVPFRRVWETSLHASGVRLRNARGWT